MAFKHVFVSSFLPERCKRGVKNINNFKNRDPIWLLLLHIYTHFKSSSTPVANLTSRAEGAIDNGATVY